MSDRPANKGLAGLQERLRDPLLTALTLLLALMMFVIAPLHATALTETRDVGFFVALLVTAAVLVLSGNPIAVGGLVVAIGLSATAAVLRREHPSLLDVYLNATAWILIGLSLVWVVAQAVFAPGRITYHRIMGAVLLYLAIGVTFVALFTFVGALDPHAFAGMSVSDSPTLASTMIYFSFGNLTTAGSGDIAPLSPVARSLTNLEAIVGQLYSATLLARLVTLEIEGEAKR
jgi:hypothetical protein